jgi:uncharacterized protein (UPF0548 family)
VFFALRPSQRTVDRFIAKSQSLPLSYARVGLVRSETIRGRVSRMDVAIGHGAPDFERAKQALASWKPFDLGWVWLFPKDAPIEPGTVVAVLIRHVGFWSLNGCRIVYGVDDRKQARFGFAYGTLTNHAEAGEELFEVSLNRQTGDVMYRIRATSRPRAALARIGHPVVRILQARFRRDSAAAMKRATRADGIGR